MRALLPWLGWLLAPLIGGALLYSTSAYTAQQSELATLTFRYAQLHADYNRVSKAASDEHARNGDLLFELKKLQDGKR